MHIPQRNRLLPVEKHRELAAQFTVVMIMTPWSMVSKVQASDSVGCAKELMSQDSFDQLGVQNQGHFGLVRDTSFTGLDEQALITDMIEWYEPSGAITNNCQLIDGLNFLIETPSRLVTDNGEVVGLVHRSDFNKQAVRTYLYLWLSALEMGLAEFIRREIPDHDDWIPLLSDPRQVNVAGNLYLAQRKKAELVATEYLDLSDLVGVVTKASGLDKEMWRILGYNSKSQWSEATGPLVTLRNCIMHPVRTLVSDSDSVKRLVDCDAKLKVLVCKLRDYLFQTQGIESKI